MARARDKMIHNYYGFDYDIVWKIITEKIPALKEFINENIREFPKD